MSRLLNNISLFYLIQGDHYPMILSALIISVIGIIGIMILVIAFIILICCLYWKFRQRQQQLQPDNAPNDGGEN